MESVWTIYSGQLCVHKERLKTGQDGKLMPILPVITCFKYLVTIFISNCHFHCQYRPHFGDVLTKALVRTMLNSVRTGVINKSARSSGEYDLSPTY